MSKITIVNITGQPLIIGTIKEQTDKKGNRREPKEPLILEGNSEVEVDEKEVEKILNLSPNIRLKSSLKIKSKESKNVQ